MNNQQPRHFNGTEGKKRYSYKQYQALITGLKVFLDASAVMGGVSLAKALLANDQSQFLTGLSQLEFPVFSIWVAVVGLIIFYFAGLYRNEISFLNFEEMRKIIKALLVLFFVISPGIIFVGLTDNLYSEAKFLFSSYIITFTLVIIERSFFYKQAKYNFKNEKYIKRIAIYDACPTGVLILKKLSESPQMGWKPIGFIDNTKPIGAMIATNSEQTKASVPVLGKMNELRELVANHGIEEVFIATPAIQIGEMRKIITECRLADIPYRFIPNLLDEPFHRATMYTVGNVPFIQIKEPKASLLTSLLKRLIDVVLSSVLLIMAAPFMLIIALVIRKDSVGPIIFKQQRIGRNGQPFTMYKFRTMHIDSPGYGYSYSPTDLMDERITRVGKFLRRTSLDEVPQFYNVLKNDMSIVGPRPEMPFIVENYTEVQRERLIVKPGITGLWQITLDRSRLIHENLDYDFYYIKNMSVLLDMLIIFKTIWFAIRGVAAF